MARDMSEQIQTHLTQVATLRAARAANPVLAARVAAIKRHQHERFTRDYADLLASERYGAAARFFLDDLYGPADFAERDAQFSRIVPAMTRLLPADVVQTVAQLAELHALSESLDQEMGGQVSGEVDERSYRAAWNAVGRAADRQRQIELLVAIGASLDRHTRTPMLKTSLRLMRGPATAAGLGQLQSFLERGLTAFIAMRGARDFLDRITANERRTIAELFSDPQREKPGQRS